MVSQITDHTELGEVMINHGFPGLTGTHSPLDEVAARARTLQAGRVDCGSPNPPTPTPMHVYRRIQQMPGVAGTQQTLRGFLQRRKMRHLPQTDQACQRRIILQIRDDAPIVGSQEVLQRQAGKELMLSELLRTTAMRILW